MLEFCRAIVVAPTSFDSQALSQVATQVGFGDIANIFNDAESNGLKYPVTYFLVHHRLADADCEDIVYAVRKIERNGLCYSPMIMMISDAPSEVARRYVRMGFDDVISLPQSQLQVAERLESQLDSEIVYFQTAEYLGPDRRRLDPDGALQRPVSISVHTQLIIQRDTGVGNRVLSRQLRGHQHLQPARHQGFRAETAVVQEPRTFGRRLQPPVPTV